MGATQRTSLRASVGVTTWPTVSVWAELNSTITDPADPSTSGNWTDIGSYLESASTNRGASRFDGPIMRYEASTSTVVLKNTDARFDPLNTASPYYSGGVTQVQPARQYSIIATWSAVKYYLWRGWADSWTPQYPLNGKSAITTLAGTDALAIAARNDVSGAAFHTTNPETQQVIYNYFSLVPVPYHGTLTLVADGVVCVDMSTVTGNALSGAQLATDTEIGELYLDGNANIVFRLRNDLFNDARSQTSQATFQPGTTLPFEDLTVEYGAQGLKNSMLISSVGDATVANVGDTPSQAAYQKRTYTRSDLLHRTFENSNDYAGFLLALQKDPELRIASMTINPQAAPTTLFPQVLGRELGDRITVTFTPPGGTAITRACFIRGINHEITPDSWITKWTLQDATRYDLFLILDDANRGILDTDKLGY